ncbi:Chorion peroxidase, partial [Armadillidium vulgare]
MFTLQVQSYQPPINSCAASRFPCSPLVYCSPFYNEVVSQSLNCEFQPKAYGACCRFPNSGTTKYGQKPSSTDLELFLPLRIGVEIQSISVDQMRHAEHYGFKALTEQEKFEEGIKLQREGVTVTNPQRPEYGHLQFFRTSPAAKIISRGALVQGFTGLSLMKILDLSPAQASFGLQGISALDSPRLQVTCPPPPRCGKKEKFYRTSDGSCNNIYNPRWGQARTAFERIVPPRYADGISSPRRSVTGNELPSPRLVSQSNVPDINRPSREFTLSVMQWGQFLDHDLTHTPIFRFGNSSGIECCHENGQFIARSSLHPECFPISIPANDPFYSRFGRRCMNFVRSLPATTSNCTLGHREQMNQVTHYLDGSTLYGSSDEDQKELRTGFGGLLRFQDGALLPIDRFIGGEDCFHSGAGLGCFAAGDSRNCLQEASHSYGTSTAEAYNLLPLREGFTHNYDRFLSAQIRNEFASIGFRFGHTLVEGMVRLFDKSHNNRESINLFEHFNRPGIIYRRFDELLRVLFKQPMQSFDNNIVD